MKCCGDVEEFCVEPQLLLTTLLCREQIDADGVIKDQIAGILTQDLCGLFREKRIGNVESGMRDLVCATVRARPVSNERFDGGFDGNMVILPSELDFVTTAFSQRLQARKTAHRGRFI